MGAGTHDNGSNDGTHGSSGSPSNSDDLDEAPCTHECPAGSSVGSPLDEGREEERARYPCNPSAEQLSACALRILSLRRMLCADGGGEEERASAEQSAGTKMPRREPSCLTSLEASPPSGGVGSPCAKRARTGD